MVTQSRDAQRPLFGSKGIMSLARIARACKLYAHLLRGACHPTYEKQSS